MNYGRDFYNSYLSYLKSGKVPEDFNGTVIQCKGKENNDSFFNLLSPKNNTFNITQYPRYKKLCREVAILCHQKLRNEHKEYSGEAIINRKLNINPFKDDYTAVLLNIYQPVVTCDWLDEEGAELIITTQYGQMETWSFWEHNILSLRKLSQVDSIIKEMCLLRKTLIEGYNTHLSEVSIVFSKSEVSTNGIACGLMPQPSLSGEFKRYHTASYVKGKEDLVLSNKDFYSLKAVLQCDPTIVVKDLPTVVSKLGLVNDNIVLGRAIKPVNLGEDTARTLVDLIQEKTDYYLALNPENSREVCIFSPASNSLSRDAFSGHYGSSDLADIFFAECNYSGFANRYLSYKTFKKVIRQGITSFDDYSEEIKGSVKDQFISDNDAQLIFLSCFNEIKVVGKDKDGNAIDYTFYGMWKYNKKSEKFYLYISY